MPSDKWDNLHHNVKNCPYIICPRNPSNFQAEDPLAPILFNRKEGSLNVIRCLVISQEPGSSLRKDCNNDVDLMEQKLCNNCKGFDRKGEKQREISERGTSPVNMMIRFFGTFDLETGPIYWTHALKCIPTKDSLINNQWESCAPFCVNHLKAEISAIPAENIALVSIGRYALMMCRSLLFHEDLKPKKITSYIQELKEIQPIYYNSENQEKLVYFLSFLHPSNRNRILARYDKGGKIVENESKQERFLKDFIAR